MVANARDGRAVGRIKGYPAEDAPLPAESPTLDYQPPPGVPKSNPVALMLSNAIFVLMALAFVPLHAVVGRNIAIGIVSFVAFGEIKRDGPELMKLFTGSDTPLWNRQAGCAAQRSTGSVTLLGRSGPSLRCGPGLSEEDRL